MGKRESDKRDFLRRVNAPPPAGPKQLPGEEPPEERKAGTRKVGKPDQRVEHGPWGPKLKGGANAKEGQE